MNLSVHSARVRVFVRQNGNITDTKLVLFLPARTTTQDTEAGGGGGLHSADPRSLELRNFRRVLSQNVIG